MVPLPYHYRALPWVDSGDTENARMDQLASVCFGAAQSFCGPLLGALALALAGHQMLNRTMSTNQAWNDAGNIVAAAAIGLVKIFGLTAVFYSVAACSILAAASVLWIRESDLDERVAGGLVEDEQKEVTGFQHPCLSR